MIRNCVIVDDFLPRAEKFRELALRQTFGPVDYEGHMYDGIARDVALFSIPGMQDRFERAVGFPVEIAMEFWRVGMEGETLPDWIHADSICSDLAALIYLSEPSPASGTAFWRHRSLGWDELPAEGIDQNTSDRLFKDSHDARAWDQTDFIYGRFNRLAVYPTARFHSRYPRHAEGDSPEAGRLIWVGFMNKRSG